MVCSLFRKQGTDQCSLVILIPAIDIMVPVDGNLTGFPQGLENRENREKNNGQGKVREKSGNFILGQKSGKSQGILFQTADSHENLLLFLSIIEKVCHQYHEYESAHVNFQKIYFLLFQVLHQQH